MLLVFVAIPFAVDFSVHDLLERRAREFSRTQARVVSIEQPAKKPRFRGTAGYPYLDVLVEYERDGMTKTLGYSVSGWRAPEFLKAQQPGSMVEIWVSATEAQPGPPWRVAMFEWFPYLYLILGGILTMAYLFLDALRLEYKRFSGGPHA